MRNLVITDKGKELMAGLVAGTTTATFTKIETSDHNYSAGPLKTLTTLDDVKQTAFISNVTKKDTNLVQVVAAINNTDLVEGYYVRAVGLYARDSNNTEILYGISIETENPDYMPKWGGEGKTPTGITYYFNAKVDDAEQVMIEINPAAAASAAEVQNLGTRISEISIDATRISQKITEITSELANKQKKNIIKTIAIENSAWEDYSDSNNDYKKKKIVAVENLTADDIVYLNYDLSCKAAAQDANASHVESESGQIVVYAESVPSKALTAQLVIQKS